MLLTPVQQQMYWQMMLAPAGVVLYPWIQLMTSLAAQAEEHRRRSMHLTKKKR
jgi:hypothetical protein